jgi:hypothetical protein
MPDIIAASGVVVLGIYQDLPLAGVVAARADAAFWPEAEVGDLRSLLLHRSSQWRRQRGVWLRYRRFRRAILATVVCENRTNRYFFTMLRNLIG